MKLSTFRKLTWTSNSKSLFHEIILNFDPDWRIVSASRGIGIFSYYAANIFVVITEILFFFSVYSVFGGDSKLIPQEGKLAFSLLFGITCVVFYFIRKRMMEKEYNKLFEFLKTITYIEDNTGIDFKYWEEVKDKVIKSYREHLESLAYRLACAQIEDGTKAVWDEGKYAPEKEREFKHALNAVNSVLKTEFKRGEFFK